MESISLVDWGERVCESTGSSLLRTTPLLSLEVDVLSDASESVTVLTALVLVGASISVVLKSITLTVRAFLSHFFNCIVLAQRLSSCTLVSLCRHWLIIVTLNTSSLNHNNHIHQVPYLRQFWTNHFACDRSHLELRINAVTSLSFKTFVSFRARGWERTMLQ